MPLVPAGSGHFTSSQALQVVSWEITATQFWGCTPQLSLLPFLAPSTPSHTRICLQWPFSSHHSRKGDTKDGLKLQELPSSSWTVLRPEWYFNNLVSFWKDPHGHS